MAGYDGQVVINTKLDDKGLKKGIVGLQDTTVGALKKIKGVMATVGIGVGVAAAVKGINNLIKSTAEYTDRIDKQSQKIGMSKRGYQEWDFILSDLGADVDGLQLGLKTLSSAMDEANRGNKEYGEMFKRLGVDIKDTNGNLKDQETIFNEVFDALAGMESQTERTAIASRLLGRSSTELAPALNAGADEIQNLRDRAYELNTVLDDTTIAIGVNFGDQVDRMKRALQTASARAIAPFMDDLADLATAFSDNVIPKIEKFMSTAFKVGLSIPPIFQFVKAVVVAVLKEIGEALDGPWTALKGFISDLGSIPVVKNTIEFIMKLGGDLWEGLKAGVKTGDWSKFWNAAFEVAEFSIAIFASLQLASITASLLWSTIQTNLVKGGFSTVGLASWAIAMVSIGLAVRDAMVDGDWTALANNLTAALTAALIAGGLTKSAKVGALAFTIALGFKLGEGDIMTDMFGKPEEAAEEIKKFFKNAWDLTGLEVWWDEVGRNIGSAVWQGVKNFFKLIDIVGATVDLVNLIKARLSENSKPDTESLGIPKYNFSDEEIFGLKKGIQLGTVKTPDIKLDTTFAVTPASQKSAVQAIEGVIDVAYREASAYAKDLGLFTMALRDINVMPDDVVAKALLKSTELGKDIVAGLKLGTEAEIASYAAENADLIIKTFKEILGIRSPSTEFKRIGTEVVNGLERGISGMYKTGEDGAQDFLDAVQDVLGVHSESEEGHWIGNEFVNGIINGLIEMFPELKAEAEKMRDALAKIWTEQPASPSGEGGGGTPPVPAKLTFGQQLGGIWDDLVEGWKSAREEMSKDIDDWATWSAAKFMNIGATLGNALGAGMQVLGQSIATQQQTIEELGNSIEDVQDSLSEAYEDLEDAQDDYADAVLSGDSDAIKAAEKRLKQQQKLVDGYEEQLKALREEKRSVEDGSKAWKDFAKTILGALSDTLYGLGAELAARAILAAITFNWAGAAAATAGSAVAFGAAIALDAWAGSFAEGGIVPQVSGVSPTGDKHVASVNPGELILNAAQQQNVAAQLAMLSRLTELIASINVSSHSIVVNMSGATINGLDEEKVGRAIYRNIKTLQHEGVLGTW